MSRSVDGYVTVGRLARGGMGDVLLGLRSTGSFRRMVAIKRLRAEFVSDPSFRRMFLDEAKIAGLIRHANVVSVLDVGNDEEGPFLVMDFIEGLTASAMLAEIAAEDEKLPVQVVARIIAQCAQGLAAAHELTGTDGAPLGLIHRDVSPQNILLGFDGVVRLTDFGIAKAAGSSQQTSTGLLKGKVGYMSPEQLRFQPPTQKSDLFALGVVLNELLSGKRLYEGEDDASVARHVLADPPPDIFMVRDDVPPALTELSFELLAKEAAHRPESAREVARRLEEIVDELVAVEGALRLEEFMQTRFMDAWESLKDRNETLLRIWEETRASEDAASSLTRRWWAAGVAAALVAGGAAAFLALSMTTSAAPAASSGETTTAEVDAGAPADAGVAPVVEDAQALTEAETAVSDSEARPRMRRRRRPRRRNRRARAMGAMEEDFSALELIKMTR